MSRQYPHSDKIQPRFAAWLWSIGQDACPEFTSHLPVGWRTIFMRWIYANIRRAYEMNMGVSDTSLSRFYGEKQLQVTDQDEFTEACWIIADEQRAHRVAAE